MTRFVFLQLLSRFGLSALSIENTVFGKRPKRRAVYIPFSAGRVIKTRLANAANLANLAGVVEMCIDTKCMCDRILDTVQ